MAKPRASDAPAPASPRPTTPPRPADPTRCAWTTTGAQCLLRGTNLYGYGEHPTRYCAWHAHVRTASRAVHAAHFETFEAWCLSQRAHAYCGEFYEFSHADPVWLYGLITGDDRTPIDPPARVGCAKTSCYYGWNGQSAATATRAVVPADAGDVARL